MLKLPENENQKEKQLFLLKQDMKQYVGFNEEDGLFSYKSTTASTTLNHNPQPKHQPSALPVTLPPLFPLPPPTFFQVTKANAQQQSSPPDSTTATPTADRTPEPRTNT